MKRTEKLSNLESMRGIAALSVAFYHFQVGSHFNNGFVANAWLMVDFFFVLSGFVIALNYRDRLRGARDLFIFQKKRFLRLYPLHFIMLTVFLGIEFAKYIAEIELNLIADNRAFSKNNLAAFFANAALLQSWVISDLTFNYPSWSISAEFYTYAIFALLALFAASSRNLFYSLSSLVILVTGLVLNETGMGASGISGPARCLYSFFIGVIAHGIYKRFDLKGKLNSSGVSFSMLVLCAVVVFFADEIARLMILVPFVFAVTILSLVATRDASLINKALGHSRLVYLGTISYGIYMIHVAVWKVFVYSLHFVFNVPMVADSEGKERLAIDNVYLADLISLAGILLIIALAHFSYVFLESRFDRSAKQMAGSEGEPRRISAAA